LAGERRLPTFEAMLGAVGGLVVLAGVFALFSEVPEDEARLGGLALSLLTLVVGCVLTAARRSSALDAAGVVLAAGAVVPLAFLALHDPEQVDSEGDLLVTALVAVLVWIVLFALGPARGHGLFLGLALFGMWTGAMGQTDPGVLLFPFWWSSGVAEVRTVPPIELEGPEVPDFPARDFPDPDLIQPPQLTIPDFRTPRTFPTPSTVAPPTFPEPSPMPSFRFEPPERFRPHPPTTETTAVEQSLGRTELVSSVQGDNEGDEGTIDPIEPFEEPPLAPGVVSVLFGLAYVLGAALLDSARLRRLASPFHLVGLLALTIGTVLLGPRLGAAAAGGAGVVFGLAVVALGVLVRRRFVAWYAGGASAVAVATLVGSVFADSPAAGGISLLVVGAAVVAVGVAGGMPSTVAEQRD
jgi:hypothetical protein